MSDFFLNKEVDAYGRQDGKRHPKHSSKGGPFTERRILPEQEYIKHEPKYRCKGKNNQKIRLMINSNWGNSIAFSLKKYVYECLTEYNVQPKATFQQAGLKRRSTSVRRFHSQCSLPDRPYTRLYPFMDTDLSYTEYQELSRRYHHFLGRNGNFRRAGARIARTHPG